MASFSPGSLVRARGREWVVLPDSTDEMLLLQPLGAAGNEITGLYAPNRLESVEVASFAPPDPALVGDARASRMLRNAVRLGFRSGAGPFRSFGRIAVEPRPYQLVPLLLALQLDTVRLLIADDVGVGKTVEAGLIARELLDRGEITRMSVLCPPHLAQQWVDELREKFHLEAQAVLSSTARRLEAPCGPGESLFDYHPITVVSLDYIKTDKHRNDFLQHCPELVIVDEAHTCAQSGIGARQQRHKLLQQLAQDPKRHLILVSATPHSGNADAFRSLLSLLRPDFGLLPDDLSGTLNAEKRRSLSRHLVQRRRQDIEHYMDADTPFPQREELELGYNLSSDYKKLFDRVLAYAREAVTDNSGSHVRQRVRWWAALGLLRALASSPRAAAATLEARARNADAPDAEQADAIGRRGVLDLAEDESSEAADLVMGARTESDDEGETADSAHSRRLRDLARQAKALEGASDRKLQLVTEEARKLLDAGFSPIIFCRFIETANYVAEHLKTKLRGVDVAAVTGLLAPDLRENAIEELAAATQQGRRRVLVATDCLSEGINLQAYFDAVVHYDLPWNPTRLEQREGRVDRFGQKKEKVRALLIYGKDNAIDGIVLDVLLRKHRQIRKTLGVSVPVPANTDSVVEAIFEGLLLRGINVSSDQMSLFDDLVKDNDFNAEWDAATEREKRARSRTVFSHEGIKAEDVAREVEAMRRALGGAAEVEAFVRDALGALNVPVTASAPSVIDLTALPKALSEPLQTSLPAANWKRGTLRARFDTANAAGESLLGRTHPLVATLAAHTLETALDAGGETPIAARCGAMRTDAVSKRTTLLLLRLRFQIHERAKGTSDERSLLAEDCALVGFRGAPDAPQWLGSEETEALLCAVPSGNLTPDQSSDFVQRVVEGQQQLAPHLEQVARERAEELGQAHRRVRDAIKTGGSVRVEPTLPPDWLGVWVFVPQL